MVIPIPPPNFVCRGYNEGLIDIVCYAMVCNVEKKAYINTVFGIGFDWIVV